jgi:hypothetical protein
MWCHLAAPGIGVYLLAMMRDSMAVRRGSKEEVLRSY